MHKPASPWIARAAGAAVALVTVALMAGCDGTPVPTISLKLDNNGHVTNINQPIRLPMAQGTRGDTLVVYVNVTAPAGANGNDIALRKEPKLGPEDDIGASNQSSNRTLEVAPREKTAKLSMKYAAMGVGTYHVYEEVRNAKGTVTSTIDTGVTIIVYHKGEPAG
jgi:hypothetical protein